jgi:hypothetical protein
MQKVKFINCGHEHNIVSRIDCNLNHEVLNYSVESAVFETDRFATCTMLR